MLMQPDRGGNSLPLPEKSFRTLNSRLQSNKLLEKKNKFNRSGISAGSLILSVPWSNYIVQVMIPFKMVFS